jgi:ATP-dependent Clp protease protease subunit
MLLRARLSEVTGRAAGDAPRSWYAMRATEDPAVHEIRIYEEIGFWGVTARQFADDLAKVTAKMIVLRLNSPGGDVFDGLAIFNALRNHPARIQTHVDGLAASMASVIALAGDEIRIADNAFMMIHNPWTIALGDATAMRKTADLLDKVGNSLRSIYVGKTKKPEAKVRELMDAETWFTADEAKDFGLVDAVEPAFEAAAAAKFDLSIFDRVPDTLRAGEPAPRETAVDDDGGTIFKMKSRLALAGRFETAR